MHRFAWFAIAFACKSDPAARPEPAGSGSAPAVDAAAVVAVVDTAPAPRTITSAGVAGITATTKATKAAIAPLLPELSFTEEESNDAEGNPTFLVTGHRGGVPAIQILAADSDATTAMITISDPAFVTETGIKVGDPVKSLAAKYKGVTCSFEQTEIDELTCATDHAPKLRFDIDLDGGPLKLGPTKPGKIAKRSIISIVWIP